MFNYYKKFQVGSEDYFFGRIDDELAFGYKHPDYKHTYLRTNFGNSNEVIGSLKIVFDEWDSKENLNEIILKFDDFDLSQTFHIELFGDTDWTLSATQSVEVSGKEYIKHIYNKIN